MPQIDRYLAVLTSHNADALDFVENDLVSLRKQDTARPVTKHALTASQILVLLSEIAPADVAGRVPLVQQLLATARGPVTAVLLPVLLEAAGDQDLPAVAELDLNPVLALPDRCVAVDARVRVRRPEISARAKSW